MNDQYDGQTLKLALKSAERVLEKRIDEINAINVFPVPDGDTGINMFLTLQSATAAVETLSSRSAAEVSSKAAWGALMGARGNSGVIFSQILHGMAKALELKERFTAGDFAMALHSASEAAYRAVRQPAEGTIITVIREACEAAQKKASRGANLHETMRAVVTQARDTVRRTPELLPALKEAHVVDAGAKGLMYIFQGMKEFTALQTARARKQRTVVAARTKATAGAVKSGVRKLRSRYGYDLQFMMEGKGLPLEDVREKLCTMGDSVLVVGDSRLLRVHIHTRDAKAVLDYCAARGALKDVRTEDMDEQAAAYRSRRKASARAARPLPAAAR